MESDFVKLTRRLQKGGFQLVYLEHRGDVRAVAGFRLTENLVNGRFMYVDDLVTNPDERSKGYGQRLFEWLIDHAELNECNALSLDSGVQRFDVHRFYLRNKMHISSHHFWLQLQLKR